MDQTVQRPAGRRINWTNVITVLSAAILIGAEVFGAAYAGGWAVAGPVRPRRLRRLRAADRVLRRRRRRDDRLRAQRATRRAVRQQEAERARHFARFRSRACCARVDQEIWRRVANTTVLDTRDESLMCASCPISHVPVAVCRSVGIRTRGRTAAWSEIAKTSCLRSSVAPKPLDRQPEAKPAHPALNGGRGLKQRRSGLFWSRWPSKGQHRRGLSIIAGRAERDSPAPIQGSIVG